jgi:hypothetical protein
MSDSPSHQAELTVTKIRVQVEEAVSDVPVFSVTSNDEPVVTRRELWSYYCVFLFSLRRRFTEGALKCTIMEITCVSVDLLLRYNILLQSSLVINQGVGPLGLLAR